MTQCERFHCTGSFYFEAGIISDDAYKMVAKIPHDENLYVNFQWFETDVNNYHLVYALLGNENAPDALNARIYTFDIFDAYVCNVFLCI